jgi:hypothetical protein
MPDLSLHDIDLISRDIRRQEITFSHLLDELIDHVCCDVEGEMMRGLNFSEAYLRVKEKMGTNRLKEIQKETLYAVDTKYRYMKNLMKISGVAGTVLLGFAAMFKIQHWPGAGIMMTLGALILAFVFLPSALGVLWKETHSTKRIFLFISAFLTGMSFIAGTLFKIQHWPYADFIALLGAVSGILFFIPSLLVNRLYDQENKAKRPLFIIGAAGSILFVAGLFFKVQHWPFASLIMVLGLICLCILFIPWYTWITWKDESHISPVFIFLIVGSLLIIMPGAMVNLNLQHSYQEYYFPNNSQQNELYNYLYKNNSSLISMYRDSLSYSKLEQLHERTIEVLTFISNIQEKMVQESEGEPGRPALSAGQIGQTETGHEILYRELSMPFHTSPVKDFLLKGCPARENINLAMAGYLDFLGWIVPGEDIFKYKKILDPSTYLPGENTSSGEISLMSGLHSLEIMKNGLLTVESCVVQKITRH